MKNILRTIERGIVKGAIWIYCKIVYRFELVGQENIPKEGPVIICGNHRSFLDPPLMEVTTGRYTRFLAKEELTKNKFLAYLGKVFDAILVKRDSKEVMALKESLKTLKNGDCLALFPEGTRNGLAKGEKVKDGAAFFAVRSGAPVVPCGIKGGEKGNRKVTITYGKPLDFSQYKGSKDKEMIRFGQEEAHIRTNLDKEGMEYRVDMHLKKSKSKGIAVNGQHLKKAAQLLGLLNVVFFSPEDLSIIKNGPSERRRFVDMELCQIDKYYLYNLNQYNKIVNQRNKLLKDFYHNTDISETLHVWDMQLVTYGKQIIERRKEFVDQLNEIIYGIHKNLSGDREELVIVYEPDTEAENLENDLRISREKDIKYKMTSVGPHRDDFSFVVNGVDIRKYGSQGQQRTAALSLKLSEIELVKKVTGDNPVLLLDDVLSELDSNRQNYLLNNIGNIQTIITCTGLDEFINNRFSIDKIFKVTNGRIESEN